MRIVEEVPEALHPEVAAALAWVKADTGRPFKLTGVVDPRSRNARAVRRTI